jgi:hypothetical protein
MGIDRLLGAWLVTLACLAGLAAPWPVLAQTNFDRPGGDYMNAPIASGDPADCALLCERARRCRAWSFNYPTVIRPGAVCWLKNSVPPRVADNCCVSGVRGGGVVEIRNGAVETSIDRPGGDYRSFDIKSTDASKKPETTRSLEKSVEKDADKSEDKAEKNEKAADAEDICRAACTGDNKCRAWTFARPGYVGKAPHCFLKKEIKPPHRRAGFISGVVR